MAGGEGKPVIDPGRRGMVGSSAAQFASLVRLVGYLVDLELGRLLQGPKRRRSNSNTCGGHRAYTCRYRLISFSARGLGLRSSGETAATERLPDLIRFHSTMGGWGWYGLWWSQFVH
jgi:hypothetical protein